MQAFKQGMSFSKREQYAIIFLMVMMLILLIINLFPQLIIKNQIDSFHNLDSIAAARGEVFDQKMTYSNDDKFEAVNPEKAALEIKLQPFPFDPNRLPAEEWKKIGLNDKQILNILNYEKKGGKFYKKSDLQKIYSLSLAEFKMLEPFIKIPESNTEKYQKEKPIQLDSIHSNEKEMKMDIVYELNSIDSLQLIDIQNVGPWFAHRILQYRRSLGGYLRIDQLREVYGMDSLRFQRISRSFTVDPSKIQLLAINRRTFKELIRHPYMNYNLTKSIVNKRERQGFVKSWNELVILNANDSVSIARLKPYLGYN
jgi:DNA uptake protein ComE-like DNA-binding protein